MTIQSSGVISMADINTELSLATVLPISLDGATVRSLLGKATGMISLSDAYGKSVSLGPVSFVAAVKTDSGNFTYHGWAGGAQWLATHVPVGTPQNVDLVIGAGIHISYFSWTTFSTFHNLTSYITSTAPSITIKINGVPYVFNYVADLGGGWSSYVSPNVSASPFVAGQTYTLSL